MARPNPPRAPPCYAPRPVGTIEKRRVASATPALPGAKPFAVSVVPTFLQAAHTKVNAAPAFLDVEERNL
eukprot:2286024-Prymnesium_polylepis.1